MSIRTSSSNTIGRTVGWSIVLIIVFSLIVVLLQNWIGWPGGVHPSSADFGTHP